MSKVYEQKPNVVKATFEDKTGSKDRFIVGDSLDDVLKNFDAFYGTSDEVAALRRPKRHRRTKAELAKVENENENLGQVVVAETKPKRGRKSKSLWPETEEKKELVGV